MSGEDRELDGVFTIVLDFGHLAIGVGTVNPLKSRFLSCSLSFSEPGAKRRLRSLGARGEGVPGTGDSALDGTLLIGSTMKVGSLIMGVGAGTLG